MRPGARCVDLVAASAITAADHVVEIGPGRGALTRALLRRAGRVTAVELDPVLCDALARGLGASPQLTLVRGDFLAWPLPRGPYKVFANPPFAHTAAIVRRLTEARPRPRDVHLVVERGAALRFAGRPYADETLRSLLLAPWWHVEVLRELRPADFDPPPPVHAALLWLAPRERPLVDASEAPLYRAFVRTARARRAPSVRAALRGLLTPAQLRREARLLRLALDAPVASLDFRQWLGLFRGFAARADRAARARLRAARTLRR